MLVKQQDLNEIVQIDERAKLYIKAQVAVESCRLSFETEKNLPQ
jgi:hypothetical protein